MSPNTRYRHFGMVLSFISLFLLVAPLWADDETPNHFAWAQAFQFDCDEDEDCTQAFFLDASGGYLGVELTNLSADLRAHFGVPDDVGVMVSRVVDDSPASRAGLQVGDIITHFDGKPMTSSRSISRVVRAMDTAGTKDIDLYRNGELYTLSATVEVRERESLDLSAFMADRGTLISDAVNSIDWEELGTATQHISAEAIREALGSVEHLFTEEKLEGFLQNMESFNHEDFAARMDELRVRMEELERRIQDETP